MEYAYSVIEFDHKKELKQDDDFVYVSGIASTPTPDRHKDIVEPMGAKFSTPMPFLWMHNDREPVGEMTFAKPNKNGIPFKAQIPKIQEEGLLKDRIDLAIHSLKYKLVKAVSIGFKALEWAWMEETGGIHFQEWEWLELSLVTIPANPEAVLDTAKSIDRVNRAALGIKDTHINDYLLPGATGHHKGARRPIQLIPAKRY